jgi:hypothetical protein
VAGSRWRPAQVDALSEPRKRTFTSLREPLPLTHDRSKLIGQQRTERATLVDRNGLGGLQQFRIERERDSRLHRIPRHSQIPNLALNRRFDVVLAESLDRFSRDQEDTAGLFKRLTFAGVNIVTIAEGDITHLHIGFKGTMNALFLKDLAEKTHRGLRGRVEDGKSAGGLCYGYRVVKALNAGTVTTGEREINPEQAAVVERIFRDFLAGVSPKQVAKNLNREGIAGPFGGAWSPSTIYGNGKRGTGILNNELYIGRLVWNRLRYVKNPDTGKRVSRLNPQADAEPHADADHRSCEPSVPRQAQRLDRGLRERVRVTGEGARHLRQGPGRHDAGAGQTTTHRGTGKGRGGRHQVLYDPAR